jgi:DNA-binding response OmpR family regulator
MSSGDILIVDDHPNNLTLLAGILRDAGFGVRAANNGIRALSVAAARPPELVLLDIQMPEMNGYEVCAKLKADERLSRIPVIFISALDDAFDKVRAFQAGGVDYVTKPFDAEEVLARVESQLKIFRLQRELERRNAHLQRMYDEVVRSQQTTRRVFSALSETLPGTVLDETYRLDAMIGQGGFGTVFRATHLALERPVAIKVLHPTLVNDSNETLARFRIEGVAACRISHPNAVEVLDFGVSSSGIPYLVMELLRGYTVGWVLSERGRLPLNRCVPIVSAVSEALAEAHGAGIIHRDVKPENVFLHQTKRGEVVKVVDFGIAKLMDSGSANDLAGPTQTGTFVGTPDYMAPERLVGEDYDGKADVYSLGVMAYRMLSGAMPFPAGQGRGVGAVAVARLTTDPIRLREAYPVISTQIERIVMGALCKKPEGRPAAREFGAAFSAAAGSELDPKASAPLDGS